jgi:hypothetical protein
MVWLALRVCESFFLRGLLLVVESVLLKKLPIFGEFMLGESRDCYALVNGYCCPKACIN